MNLTFKNLIMLVVLVSVLASNAFAGIKPSLVDGADYPLDYKVLDVKEFCPDSDGFLPCKAAGSEITLEATYENCGDQIKSFEYTTYTYDGSLNIEIESMARKNPFADREHCLEQAKFIQKIHVINEDINGINIKNINTLYAR